MSTDLVIEAYSQHAAAYDSPGNHGSCWGRSSRALWPRLGALPEHGVVVDVGCGAGDALVAIAERLAAAERAAVAERRALGSRLSPALRLVGVEPADGLRERARARVAAASRPIEILPGRFEALPFEEGSVDYLYSLMAFHWVTDLAHATREIARVLARDGHVDLFFIGRWNGREFIAATSAIFLRHMGPARLLAAAQLRQQLTLEQASAQFQAAFPQRSVEVDEWYETHYDSLDGHWSWWVRIEGQLVAVPDERRESCAREVREALSRLATDRGIPYTLHVLHVHVGGGAARAVDPGTRAG